jgi:hypothetical protein
MDHKMIQDAAVKSKHEVAPAAEANHAKAAFERLGSLCRDQTRFQSTAVTRAFSSAIRASSQGSQSEVSEPDEVTLTDTKLDTSDLAIIRGVD